MFKNQFLCGNLTFLCGIENSLFVENMPLFGELKYVDNEVFKQ